MKSEDEGLKPYAEKKDADAEQTKPLIPRGDAGRSVPANMLRLDDSLEKEKQLQKAKELCKKSQKSLRRIMLQKKNEENLEAALISIAKRKIIVINSKKANKKLIKSAFAR